MTDLLAARWQMAVSLGFHILFAVAGIAMPVLMAVSEWRWLKSRDPVGLELTKRWARGTAVLFAVGAVSGTVLSFELGLLWPRFMALMGSVISLPFALEGFAFFLEAIFLGLYLYGWDRIPPRIHWLCGIVIAISGAVSGIFVVTANAWMNEPTGFRLVNGQVVDVDPIAAMLNTAAFQQALHMTLAAYASVGFAVAGIHALMLLREPGHRFHRAAFGIALGVGLVAALLQPLSGDLSAKHVAKHQPAKLAAMEAHFKTERRAPLRIGGIVDEATETTRGAIEIPGGLSFLAFGDPDAEVTGLEAFPRDVRPPVAVVHIAFDVMVACGTAMAAVAALAIFLRLRRRAWADARWFLMLVAACAPLGFIAIEAGWTVTEVGRQPWIVYGIMRTADAVTPMGGVAYSLAAVVALYAFLGLMVAFLLKRHVFASPPAAAPAQGPPPSHGGRRAG